MRIDFKFYKILKKKFFLEMLKYNILLQVHYIPLYYLDIFKKFKFKSKNHPISKKFYKNVVSLPIHYDLTTREIKHVVSSLKKVLKIN